MCFEDIKPGSRLRGLDPSGIAEVVQVSHFGPDALNLVFRANGGVGERLVYRGEESAFEFVEHGRAFAFDADGSLLRLASEAYRIRLAYLFDPYLAVSASQILNFSSRPFSYINSSHHRSRCTVHRHRNLLAHLPLVQRQPM